MSGWRLALLQNVGGDHINAPGGKSFAVLDGVYGPDVDYVAIGMHFGESFMSEMRVCAGKPLRIDIWPRSVRNELA